MAEGFRFFVCKGLHGFAFEVDVAPAVALFHRGDVSAEAARVVVGERDEGVALFIEIAAFARFAGNGGVAPVVFAAHEAVHALIFQRHDGFAVTVNHAVAPGLADDGECVVVGKQAHLLKFPGGVRLAPGIDVSPAPVFHHRRQRVGDVIVVHGIKLRGDDDFAAARVKEAFFAVLAEDAQRAADVAMDFDALALRHFERGGAFDGVGMGRCQKQRGQDDFLHEVIVLRVYVYIHLERSGVCKRTLPLPLRGRGRGWG